MKSKNKQLRLGALLSYASMIVGYIIQLVYTPIMIRIVGQSQYGIYNFTNSIVSYLSLFSLGFGSAYVRFYMRHKTDEDEVGLARMNGMFMTVFLILGGIAVVTGMLMVVNSDSIMGNKFTTSELALAKTLMVLMVINIAISFPLIPVVSFIQANERFVFQNSLNILRQVLNPFLALPLLLMGYGTVGMIAVTTLLSLVIGIWQIIYSVRKLSFRADFNRSDFGELKEVAIFSSFLFLNAVTDQINWNVDKFIIGRYYGAVPVAVYGIAAQLNSYYLSLSTAISNVYTPRINYIVAEGKAGTNKVLSDLFNKIGQTQFAVVLLVLLELVFIGRPFIGFWAGKNYYDAFPILMVLIIPVTIPLIQNAGIAIQQAKNMHVFRSVTYLLIAIVNIFLSLLLVQRYGALGTAFATAISLIIGNGLLMNWYYQRKIGLDIFGFWKKIMHFVPTILVVLAAGALLDRIVDKYHTVGFITLAAIILIVYFLMLFYTVLSKEMRGAIILRIKSIFA